MALVASRYARAFADVVIDRKLDADRTVQQLNDMAGMVTANADLRNIWMNPSVERDQKLKLLDAIIARVSDSRPLRNFVAVLIDQRRIGQIEEIAAQFKHELDDRLGIAEAQISSARELSQEEKAALEARLSKVSGKVVRATYARDAGLLGGVMARIGSTIYDGSVKGQLQKIRQQITGS
ncbi:MAG TPA: ATP synthase F1 subunit delta [Candidatus Angelobacter sp.]|nr:ATP synthase F1 subunit delta [Candidatus Angelobacter sp.]